MSSQVTTANMPAPFSCLPDRDIDMAAAGSACNNRALDFDFAKAMELSRGLDERIATLSAKLDHMNSSVRSLVDQVSSMTLSAEARDRALRQRRDAPSQP